MITTSEPLGFQIGLDGFVWWIGIIENKSDNLKLGRAQVRIIGWHAKELATCDLPWAIPLAPVTQAAAIPNYKENDWVVGFFLDGKLGQQPIIMGVLPAIPQGTSMLKKLASKAVKTFIKSQTGIG